MIAKFLLAGASAFALALPMPAQAGSDALLGGLVGGAIANQGRAQQPRYVAPRDDAALDPRHLQCQQRRAPAEPGRADRVELLWTFRASVPVTVLI